MKSTLIIPNNIFYNYIYLDPRKPGDYNYKEYHFDFEPIYVGKGCRNRLYEHLKETEENSSNPYKVRKLNKIKIEGLEPTIFKLHENLEELEAFEKEIYLINIIGRYNIKKGPLTNLTDGGKGPSGMTFTIEERENWVNAKPIRITNIKTGESLEFKSARFASEYINCDSANLSSIALGKGISHKGWMAEYLNEKDKEIAKINRQNKEKNKIKPLKITNIKTGESLEFKSLTLASKYINGSLGHLSSVVNGKALSHKGWTAEFLNDCDKKNVKVNKENTISRYNKYKKPIKITNIKTGESLVFESLTLASQYLNCNTGHLSMVTMGKYQSCKGWTSEYMNEEDKNVSKITREFNIKRNKSKNDKYKKPIKITNIKTGESLVFESLTLASKYLECDFGNLSYVANGKLKSCKGWTAKYL